MKFCAVIILLFFTAPLFAQSDTTKATDSVRVVYGVASFYSASLQGTKTSTGEKFDHGLPTAASNNFKLGTWVRVTNLRNGKSIIVRINDRMHKSMSKKGRVVDLTKTAAIKLDFVKRGLTRVKVEEVPKGTEE